MTEFTIQIMERGHRYGEKRPTFTWTPTPQHHAQADRNHGQTLKRLNERGGLCWSELEGVLRGIPWSGLRKDQAEAKRICLEIQAHLSSEEQRIACERSEQCTPATDAKNPSESE